MKKAVLKIIIILFIVIVLTVVAGVAINLYMVSYAKDYIALNIDDLEKMAGEELQAAVVLGAYVFDNGQPCPMLVDRLKTGESVYRAGMAEVILLSGDHGTRGYDEVNAMKSFILNNDVPKADVFLDHAGFSTYESMVRAKQIFEIESAVISTQEYHLTRAVYIARKTGINAYGIASDLRRYPRSEMVKYTLREWLARIKDFFYVNMIKPDPKFLGEKIPITGSSDKTYDKPDDLE